MQRDDGYFVLRHLVQRFCRETLYKYPPQDLRPFFFCSMSPLKVCVFCSDRATVLLLPSNTVPFSNLFMPVGMNSSLTPNLLGVFFSRPSCLYIPHHLRQFTPLFTISLLPFQLSHPLAYPSTHTPVLLFSPRRRWTQPTTAISLIYIYLYLLYYILLFYIIYYYILLFLYFYIYI